MEVPLQSRQVLDKQSLKSCEHDFERSYAAERRTRYRTIRGSSRSAIHTGFAPENVVVTGQEMGAEPPLRCRLVCSQESFQGLFLRPPCGPFPVDRFRELIAVTLVAVT